jgi:uncharacterized protein HemY
MLALALPGAIAVSAFLAARYQFRAAEQAIERHEFEEAQRHLELYLKVHFRSASAHLLAAQAARRHDSYDEAEAHLDSCLRLEGTTKPAALERMLLYFQKGDFTDIEGLLQSHTNSTDPQAALVLEALAKGYWRRYWASEALACVNKLIEIEPRHPEALLLRAQLWEDQVLKGATEYRLGAT